MNKLVILSLGLCLVHCSGVKTGGTTTIASNGVSSSGSSNASISSGASSAGSSSGASSSGQSSSSSSSGEPLSYHGAVFFASANFPAPVGASHTVLAGFVDQNSPIPNDPADCTGGTQVDSCCYRSNAATATSSSGSSGSSSSGSSSSGMVTSNTTYSAGVITLTDGTTNIGTMTPGANGAYPAFTTGTWNTGDAITAAGVGATIPSFSGIATAPPAVAVTMPTGSGPLNIASVSTSSALEVQWDGAGGTEVITVLYTASLTNGASVTCVSPDQGHVTVPSSLLANFTSGSYGLLAVARAATADASIDGGPQITVYVSTANGIAIQYAQ